MASSLLVAIAEQAPTYDLKQACHGTENMGMAGRTRQMCIETEEKAREQIKKDWQGFPAQDKSDCLRIVRIGTAPSYASLISCLETKRDHRKISPSER